MVIHLPPEQFWNGPVNWKLLTTFRGEIRNTFALSVQPESETSTQTHTIFPRFNELPAEILLQLLRNCDRATLFQLMQVSSVLRHEAKKFFWSAPDVWYLVDSAWLLGGGYPGGTYFNTDIFPDIQQVEVEFNWENFLGMNWGDDGGLLQVPRMKVSYGLDNQLHEFWRVFQHLFPRARRVVFCGESLQDAAEPIPTDIKMLAQSCPADICSLVSFLQVESPSSYGLRRRLARHTQRLSTTSEWDIIDPIWTRQSILLPPKPLNGPLGVYFNILYMHKIWCLRNYAFHLIHVHTILKSILDKKGPIICPEPACGAQFTLPAQLAEHALDFHEFRMEPSEEHKALRSWYRDGRHELSPSSNSLQILIHDEYGERDSEKRQKAEQAFLDQLEHDPLYAHSKPARECSTWRRFSKDLDLYDIMPRA